MYMQPGTVWGTLVLALIGGLIGNFVFPAGTPSAFSNGFFQSLALFCIVAAMVLHASSKRQEYDDVEDVAVFFACLAAIIGTAAFASLTTPLTQYVPDAKVFGFRGAFVLLMISGLPFIVIAGRSLLQFSALTDDG